MSEEEKAELIRIIQESHQAEAEFKDQKLDKLVSLNEALKTHLHNSLHDEEKYIREEFEAFEDVLATGEYSPTILRSARALYDKKFTIVLYSRAF